MAFTDLFTNLNLMLRWLHVLAGIAWIGHLYFFNFVNLQLQAALDDAGKKAVNPKLMPRALWWFRWGAMITFLAGWALFAMNYMYTEGVGWGPSILFMDEDGITQRAIWILFGMTLGTIMWFNVWFIIWPIQKKILSGRATPEELPAIRRTAYLASRANTYLSGPMLVGMLAAGHFPGGFTVAGLLGTSALALAVVWVAIFHADRVGASV